MSLACSFSAKVTGRLILQVLCSSKVTVEVSVYQLTVQAALCIWVEVRRKVYMSRQSKSVAARSPYRDPCSPVRKAIILAAGIGSRLEPFTDHTPKCIAPINGIPILTNMLVHMYDSGVEETVIVVGYLKEKIYALIGTAFNGMKVSYI